MMILFPIIFIAKLISFISRLLNLGSGGTWPGEIVLKCKPKILNLFFKQLKKGSIFVAGTNGKTTTTLMIKKILENEGYKMIHNDSGANLLNGIASAFIQNISWTGKLDADWGVFEVDENSLPAVLKECHSGLRAGIHLNEHGSPIKLASLTLRRSGSGMTGSLIVVLLNLFRDQLDRYGEVDVIAQKWRKSLKELPMDSKLILNADDPLIAHLGMSLRTEVETISKNNKDNHASLAVTNAVYFGLNDSKLFQKQMDHATDSIFCLNCGNRLSYEGIYYSHIGIWKCEKCGERRPKPDIDECQSPLVGVYNLYNTLAAVGVAKLLGITDKQVHQVLADFSPAFGRQEEFEVNGKKIKIFLSKNPAGFNESLRTVLNLGAKEILLVLNDRIPDGKDVSWIWDVDFEMLPAYVTPVISGDRAHDLALRIRYSRPVSKLSKNAVSEPQTPILIYEDLKKALEFCLRSPKKDEILYILPTYSAMLEVRKILKGR